ncbi:hypothetical protein E4U56_003861 [Claviceps arundinis]|uniref:Peroxisomal membrane protein PEX14 n=1 Tax=Claviceps arundinis TaxID=1623583 RepID=A0A9P7MXX7_9HYPO|nr:hypothetical protein E4U56_003861 [Claviceps arundinis]
MAIADCGKHLSCLGSKQPQASTPSPFVPNAAGLPDTGLQDLPLPRDNHTQYRDSEHSLSRGDAVVRNPAASAMAIREDLVASAAQFLQDPSVASSTVENKISFLRSKNLTEEEISVSLARIGGPAPPTAQYSPPPPSGPPQHYYPPYAQQAWQPQPPVPRRDWRDWFIMATVVSGVGYGLYSLSKRYVYPLIAPPTPERLEQDKKSIEEQFDKAFALVEQLVKDTEVLKEAEQQRTEKLDTAIEELNSVMADLKTANRRREDDVQRIRDEVQGLQLAIPKAMDNQKSLTDSRLSEINTELTSLKTLYSQRLATGSSSGTTSSYSRQPGSNIASNRSTTPTAPTVESPADSPNTPSISTEPPKNIAQGTANRPSTISSGGSATKASIPAWQMAAVASSSSAAKDAESE